MAQSGEAKDCKVIVIGRSGHGKSYFLNILASPDGEELFRTSAAGESCTPTAEEKHCKVEFEAGTTKTTMSLTLVDTPGFPDTDPAVAERRYNEVVESCRQAYNAILWVVKPERLLPDLEENYKILMREFNKTKPPVYMIVNGTSNYARLKGETKTRKQMEDFENYRKFGREVQEKASVAVARMFVSTDLGMLDELRDPLLTCLLATEKKESDMKTCGQLLQEQADARAALGEAVYEREKHKEEFNKLIEGALGYCQGFGNVAGLLLNGRKHREPLEYFIARWRELQGLLGEKSEEAEKHRSELEQLEQAVHEARDVMDALGANAAPRET